MADNVTVDNGALTDYTASTDEGVGGHVQRVKLTYSADGSETHVQADADGLLVNLGANNDVVLGAQLPAGVNNIGDVDVLSLPSLPTGANNIGDVDVLTVPAPLSTTGGGTEAAALRVTLANDSTGVVSVDDNGGALTIDAADGTVFVRSQASGTFPVSVPASATNFTKAEDAASADLDVGVPAMARRTATPANTSGTDGDYEMLQMSAGRLWASATVDAALPAGTNNIGDVDVLSLPAIPAGTNNIGDVDVLTVPADPFGANADAASATGSISAKLRFIAATGIPVTALPASTNTLEVVGDVAHDVAAAGNPVLNAGIAQDTDDTAPPNRVSTEGDAVRLATDRDGALFVRPHGPQIWSYHENSSSALTDATVHAAPGAGLSLYVTSIVVSTGAATAMNVFFEEGVTTVLGPYYLEAVAGRGFAINFAVPKKITANTALTVTTSAAIAHSIDVTGFTAQG